MKKVFLVGEWYICCGGYIRVLGVYSLLVVEGKYSYRVFFFIRVLFYFCFRFKVRFLYFVEVRGFGLGWFGRRFKRSFVIFYIL